MIDSNKLIKGNCYFIVSYFDDGMCIPDVETYIFVGVNLLEENNDITYWYFQDAESYEKYGEFSQIQDKSSREVLRVDKEALEMIYDYHGLIEVLDETRSRSS